MKVDDNENKTHCPRCGWNVEVDEGGRCVLCSALAIGDSVVRTAKILKQEADDLDETQREVRRLEHEVAVRDRALETAVGVLALSTGQSSDWEPEQCDIFMGQARAELATKAEGPKEE